MGWWHEGRARGNVHSDGCGALGDGHRGKPGSRDNELRRKA